MAKSGPKTNDPSTKTAQQDARKQLEADLKKQGIHIFPPKK